jgi:DNA-3-methyladenine glycosylase II
MLGLTREGGFCGPTLNDPLVMTRAVDHLSDADKVIGRLVSKHGPVDFKPRGMMFRSLVESILSQQINGNAADIIISRVNRIFLPGRVTPARLNRVSRSKLRRAGVSPQKTEYLKDLAARVVEGRLDLRGIPRMGDEEAIEALDEVKGVGRWTAQMVMMFSLGRTDILPTDDYGIRVAMKSAYRLRGSPRTGVLERIAEPWRPYRTVACLYLWRHKDSF